ncbi:hypothetical protein F5Y17DRAFT_342087 [Xylariaceae sp. FL0594]|nr:hypothetical protein F5Y17DRAFT_342087 [Xylariaceae sp. FL0594]
MPTTRRSSAGTARRSSPAGANNNNKQATLSFNHRVTKSSSVPSKSKSKSVKDAVANKPSPLARHVTTISEPEIDEVKVEEEVEVKSKSEDGIKDEIEVEKPEAELRAEKVTGREIAKYWRDIEAERRTKRVHQAGLTVAEKILRYWDVSSQYGPCVGIPRVKRWYRAERLGLNPPVEVLAVLMQEEKKGTNGVERAHMDDILNSTAVGSGRSD